MTFPELELKRIKELSYFYIIGMIVVNLGILALITGISHASDNVVAEVIGAEACNQGSEGLQAVANTIANRAKRQGKTPYQIVTANNQYYGYTAVNRHKVYLTCKDQANYMAKHLMELEDLTGGAEYYLLPNERIRAWHGDKTVTIGKHTFYKGTK